MSNFIWEELNEFWRDKVSKYEAYLNTHIGNVQTSFDWLVNNLPELFKNYEINELRINISNHDASKYDDEEYEAYCAYFYDESGNKEEQDLAFQYAWLHHQHNNPHHWQHWLLKEDDGDLKALDMPFKYIIEMICDWWSFSWTKNDLYEIFNWYDKNKKKIILGKETKKQVENILKQIKEKLDEEDSKKD